jgi:hypothetical protein
VRIFSYCGLGITGWVSPGTGLDILKDRKYLRLSGLWPSQNTDCCILVLLMKLITLEFSYPAFSSSSDISISIFPIIWLLL